MENDVAQPALPAIIDIGHAGDFDRCAALRPQLQRTALLSDQRLASAGQEDHRPGHRELAKRFDPERRVLRRGSTSIGAIGGATEQDERGGEDVTTCAHARDSRF